MAVSSSVISTLAGRIGAFGRKAAARGRQGINSHLPIEALPDAFTSLEHASLYAVHVDASPARDALLFDTVQNSRAKKVTLVLGRSLDAVVAALHERGFAGNGHGVGVWPRKLNVLTSPSPEHKLSIQESAALPALARLFGGLRSLKPFGFKSGALYVVEGADDWFSWHSATTLAREARYLAGWCRMRRCTMVLVLNHRHQSEDQHGSENGSLNPFGRDAADGVSLNGFHDAFTGVAYLSQSLGEMVWLTKFWRVRGAMVTAQSQALRFTPAGKLAIAALTRQEGTSRQLTRDEHRVLVTGAAIQGEPWVPAEWQIVPDINSMPDACRLVRGATVLLDYSAIDQLDDLCRVIHELRSHCGRATKIVVRERGWSMRHQNELLALSLGANLVVSRTASFSRLQCLLQSVQGKLSTRPVIPDYRAALSATRVDPLRGYLNIGLFCDQVERVIEHGRVLPIPHVLLELQLRSDVSHLEALWACGLQRMGDICSVDHDFLYLFLFGCPIADADVVLRRIFNNGSDRYFERVVRYADFTEQIARIRTDNLRNAAPDYTDTVFDFCAMPLAPSSSSVKP